MWTAIGLFLFALPLLIVAGLVGYVYVYVRRNMLGQLERVFVEKPLFIIPRGARDPDAEDVRFPSIGGLHLQGAYFKARGVSRKGVIVFGIEYGSDRWSCQSYCSSLLDAGYDVFAYEPRNQGISDAEPGYEPLQWVTDPEVDDARAALDYLKSRTDADPRGVGWFGVSKGANAGLAAAAGDRSVRCIVTDGAFGLTSVMLPYMRKWVGVFNSNLLVHGLMPAWFYAHIAMIGVRTVGRCRKVRFYHLERRMRRVRQPLLMIHGEDDRYIKLQMARALFDRASGPKEFWTVPGAKHNHAVLVAGPEYGRRVVAFFDQYLASDAITESTGKQ